MTTATKQTEAGDTGINVPNVRTPKVLLYTLAYGIFLAIPLLAALSLFLFISGWEIRTAAIETALCDAFLMEKDAKEIAGADCVETHSVQIADALKRPNWNDIWEDARTGVRLVHPEAFAFSAAEVPSLQSGRCDSLEIARFELAWISTSQDATYDSIARRIEACTQYEDETKLLKLCSGTRAPLNANVCRKSLNFLERMQIFDRSPQGRTATVSLIIANICFGTFQLAALLLTLLGVNLAARRRLQAAANSDPAIRRRIDTDDDFAPTLSTSALDAAYHAQSRSQREDEQKRLQTYLLFKDAFASQVNSGFKRLTNWGDIVVLIGLLGTLWGMLILFSALAESGSAEPLTAELAKSKMLGSLGLAFGTTIFAGILRLIYMFTVPRLHAKAEETIDRTFVNYLSGVRFDAFGLSGTMPASEQSPNRTSYIDIGLTIMKGSIARSRREFGIGNFDPTRSPLMLFAVSALIVAAATIAALLYLGDASVVGE